MPSSQTLESFLSNVSLVLQSRQPHQCMALARLTVAAHAINRYPTMRVIQRAGAVESTAEAKRLIDTWRRSTKKRGGDA